MKIIPIPDPRSSLAPSFKLPSECWSVIISHLLDKEEMYMISVLRKLSAKVCTYDDCFFQRSMESSILQPLVSGWIFLAPVVWIKLALWKILYHGIEKIDHLQMTVLFQKPLCLKHLRPDTFCFYQHLKNFSHHSCCHHRVISWLFVVVTRKIVWV